MDTYILWEMGLFKYIYYTAPLNSSMYNLAFTIRALTRLTINKFKLNPLIANSRYFYGRQYNVLFTTEYLPYLC